MNCNRIALPLTVLLFAGHVAAAETPPPAATVDQRVEKIVSQMTLEEKVDYVGGYNGFQIRGIPRLGVPAVTMADGPLGVRIGPSNYLPGRHIDGRHVGRRRRESGRQDDRRGCARAWRPHHAGPRR